MKTKNSSIIIILCLIMIPVAVNAGATLELKMISYENPSEEVWKGSRCDFFCFLQCDHIFHFGLDDAFGNVSDPKSDSIITKVTGTFQDQNKVNFSSDMSGVENPIIVRFGSWPGEVLLKVYVEDDDYPYIGNDLVDVIVQRLTVTPSKSKQTSQWTEISIQGKRLKNKTILKMSYRLYCDGGYRGKNCSYRCLATEDQQPSNNNLCHRSHPSVSALGESYRYFGDYYCQPQRDIVVHLFEWKWTDIEKECTWLAQHNFCAVQVSPPNEHRIITSPAYPWYQRYQPVSYKMTSRGGTEAQFKSMVTKCNNFGVYIYVDAVLNHMTGGGVGNGSSGSFFDGDAEQYPGVPYGPNDFHGSDVCKSYNQEIDNWEDNNEVRNCRLVGLRDLRTESSWVRDKEAEFLNKLIEWGVAGFRLDAAKHMQPDDIIEILNRVNKLNAQWFPAGTEPYIYQEVSEPVQASDYVHIGRVTEFRYGRMLNNVIRKNNALLASLKNFGEVWGEVNALDAMIFIDNHDTQRDSGTLTFFEPNLYKMAIAFELAWQYGHVQIISSYNWKRNFVNYRDTNYWIGPPSNASGVTNDVVCFNGDWICEHRWRQIFNMVKFHNTALKYPVSNWWDNGFQAIAFGRSGKGFIFINNENLNITQTLATGLPAGEYCDVITCDNNLPPCGNLGGHCRSVISVNLDGSATFTVPSGEDPMIAIHI